VATALRVMAPKCQGSVTCEGDLGAGHKARSGGELAATLMSHRTARLALSSKDRGSQNLWHPPLLQQMQSGMQINAGPVCNCGRAAVLFNRHMRLSQIQHPTSQGSPRLHANNTLLAWRADPRSAPVGWREGGSAVQSPHPALAIHEDQLHRYAAAVRGTTLVYLGPRITQIAS
jgi:hypothetical protein